VDQEERDGQQQQVDGPPTRTRNQVLLWIRNILVALAFMSIVISGYLFRWKWTGLPKRTTWDWLDLLIVPIVLAVVEPRSSTGGSQEGTQRPWWRMDIRWLAV
jgi:hypothetical protein